MAVAAVPQITATGMSFYNLTRTGAAVLTDGLVLVTNITVTNTLTLTGNSNINRLFVRSSDVVTPKTITCNGTVTASRVDFQAIDAAGSASWNLSGITGGAGDRTDNTGITFTTAATQTWSGTSGGNWSANAWTSRVPLPQDDVVVSAAFSASQTITIDMPYTGKNITFAGVSGSPAINMTGGAYTYGNITLSTGLGTITLTTAWRPAGSGSHTITTGGKSITGGASVLQILTTHGTYTMQDSLTVSTTGGLQILSGTFDANDNDISATLIVPFTLGTAQVTVYMGNGTWSTTGTATSTVWSANNTGGLVTIYAEGSTLRVTGASANTRTFAGGGHTYNIFRYNVASSTGPLIISGNNTFNEIYFFDVNNARTLTLTAGSTQTILSNFQVAGSAGKLVTINSTVGGTQATLSKPSGLASAAVIDYLSIQDSNATGGATWYAGANSTNVSNNSGWIFTAPLTQRLALLGAG